MVSLCDLRDMSEQPVFTRTSFSFAWWINFFVAFEALVTCRSRTLFIVALVDFRIRITKFYCNIPLQFVLESDRLDTGNSLDHRALAMGDMADGTDIDGCLPSND